MSVLIVVKMTGTPSAGIDITSEEDVSSKGIEHIDTDGPISYLQRPGLNSEGLEPPPPAAAQKKRATAARYPSDMSCGMSWDTLGAFSDSEEIADPNFFSSGISPFGSNFMANTNAFAPAQGPDYHTSWSPPPPVRSSTSPIMHGAEQFSQLSGPKTARDALKDKLNERLKKVAAINGGGMYTALPAPRLSRSVYQMLIEKLQVHTGEVCPVNEWYLVEYNDQGIEIPCLLPKTLDDEHGDYVEMHMRCFNLLEKFKHGDLKDLRLSVFRYHITIKYDTVRKIAKKYEVEPSDLVLWNSHIAKLKTTSKMHPGFIMRC